MDPFALNLTFDPLAYSQSDYIKTVNKVSAKSIRADDISGITITGVTITGSTVLGTTFKTSASGARIEIDGVNGIRVYNASNVLTAQISGGATNTITTNIVTANTSVTSTIYYGFSNLVTLDSLVGGTFGGSGQVTVDGSLALGTIKLTTDGTTRVTVTSSAVTIAPPIVGSNATDSSSSVTGAWKTAGGLGVAKALNVGTTISGASLSVTGNLASTSTGILILGNSATSGAQFENTTSDTVTLWNHNRGTNGNLVTGLAILDSLLVGGNSFNITTLNYTDNLGNPGSINIWVP